MKVNDMKKQSMTLVTAALAVGLLGLAGCSHMGGMGMGMAHAQGGMQRVMLSGDHELPPVKSSGSASGDVTVKPDGSVSGMIKVTGFTPTAAHIHQGAAGANGPVIVPMVKQGDDTFGFAPTAKMTPEQMQAYKAGNTYLNVHSAAHPGGEVRVQLKGGM
ncbi:MAG: CHRD domain-containing protein [Casimicrobiaceae bacterium]